MKFLIQRVNHASVQVKGETVGSIGAGLLALVGIGVEDTEDKIDAAVEKITTLRIFSNPQGKFDLSLLDIHGGILLVPQFTLFADARKGRRPDFIGAMRPEAASPFFDKVVQAFQTRLPEVQTGRFGADMKVSLENDGPVTLMLEF